MSRSRDGAPDSDSSERRKRGVWLCCVCLATTAGFLCAMAVWGTSGPIAVVFSVALVTVGVVAPFSVGAGLGAVPRIARLSLVTGLMVPAIAGLIAVFALSGFLVVLVLAGTTPGLRSLVRSRRRKGGRLLDAQSPDPSTVRAPTSWDEVALAERAPEPPQDLASLDDDALCLAWRRSFLRLQAARSAGDRLSIVGQRQEYLDELQRRSPQGLATWLASGARASGNPRPYLGDHRRKAG